MTGWGERLGHVGGVGVTCWVREWEMLVGGSGKFWWEGWDLLGEVVGHADVEGCNMLRERWGMLAEEVRPIGGGSGTCWVGGCVTYWWGYELYFCGVGFRIDGIRI